jgi:hypothetical protein
MLPSTVSHGNTPRSWNTKIRRGSGPFTGCPSMSTFPLVCFKNPPTIFSSVDLPHPDGPRMQTNSPSRASRSMFSSTLTSLPSRLNTMFTLVMFSLVFTDFPGASAAAIIVLRIPT